MGHKLKEIKQIMRAYSSLNFVLKGNSDQEDPKIYREVVKEFLGRILAIYIRDVQLPERKQIAVGVSKSLKENKVEMLIVENGKGCRTRCPNRFNNYAGCSSNRTGKKGRHRTGSRERRRHYFIKEILHQSMKHFF